VSEYPRRKPGGSSGKKLLSLFFFELPATPHSLPPPSSQAVPPFLSRVDFLPPSFARDSFFFFLDSGLPRILYFSFSSLISFKFFFSCGRETQQTGRARKLLFLRKRIAFFSKFSPPRPRPHSPARGAPFRAASPASTNRGFLTALPSFFCGRGPSPHLFVF